MVSIKVRPRGGSCHKFLSFKGTAEPSEVIARKLLAAEVTGGLTRRSVVDFARLPAAKTNVAPEDCESREVVK